MSERRRELLEIDEKPEVEAEEVAEIFRGYGLNDTEIAPVIAALRARPHDWVEFMMRFELGLEKPEPKRAMTSALTIGGAYIAGGMVPLSPYFFSHVAGAALGWSVAMTLAALLVFGYVKGRFTGAGPLRSGLQTMLIGGLAAAAAFGIARLISH